MRLKETNFPKELSDCFPHSSVDKIKASLKALGQIQYLWFSNVHKELSKGPNFSIFLYP